MKMKKIVARTMPEAMKKVRSELGSDAVILNSKVIYTGGFLGLFKKKKMEVVAGLDTSETQEQPQKVVQDPIYVQDDVASHNQLQDEIKELKAMVSTMSKQRFTSLNHFPPSIQHELERFRQQEFQEEWLLDLGSNLFDQWKQSPDDNKIRQWAETRVKEQVESLTHHGIVADKKYIYVLGPTGVGKTTTIAKIAAKLVVEKRKKVAFITTDTYRIAAIEQLKTYAQLLNVPIEVVYNRSDFDKAVEKFEDYDHVFVDTAGRNYRERQYVDELKKVIDFDMNIQSFLVLSMTAKLQDMQMIVDRFHDVVIDQFIFTKWDESASVGPAFHMMLHNETGAAYLTTGQAVPEDIIEANPESLFKLLLESVNE
ncbi:flagellar biosynthesis protein FlhF [Jeotgalibacillus marinus]|uniref:Flagellar biosynthesis protein FlhF n=1 Tax=Jeotgalibacillus marinus TaxID=86667 RepID=A0ABV3Q1T2_9BACL